MILEAILTLSAVAAVAGVVNLFNNKIENKKVTPMKIKLPGNLPIITLFNNKKALNFIVDSGSNISHICSEYYDSIESTPIGTYEEGEISGLGATTTGITMCEAILKDYKNNNYKITLSVSDQLGVVAKNIEDNTGVKIHGLLGTDFLKNYDCILDFKDYKLHFK